MSAVLAAGTIRSGLRPARAEARAAGDGIEDRGASGWVHPALRDGGRTTAAETALRAGTIH